MNDLNAPQGNAPRGERRLRFSWKFKVAALAGTIGIAVALCEISLRVLGVGYPNFYQPDDLLGIAPRPGAEGWFTTEGRGYVRFNANGYRGKDHATIKPPNTFRVAVLGDSYTEAKQVEIDKVFCSVLERELAKRPRLAGRKVEVMNFGCSAYGTAQQLLLLRARVWKFHPDVVLLAFCLGNDITDSVREIKKVDYIPYFVYRDGQLVLDDSFRDSPGYQSRKGLAARAALTILPHSRILQFLNHLRYLRRAAGRHVEHAVATPVLEDVGQSDKIYLEPQGELWTRAWRVVEDLLATMNREVGARGARFMLVSLSSSIQAFPDPEARADFERALGVEDLFYADRRLASVGRQEGFPVLNLGQPFQRYAEEHGTFLHGFNEPPGWGHWNETGHDLAGKMIADWMCQALDGG